MARLHVTEIYERVSKAVKVTLAIQQCAQECAERTGLPWKAPVLVLYPVTRLTGVNRASNRWTDGLEVTIPYAAPDWPRAYGKFVEDYMRALVEMTVAEQVCLDTDTRMPKGQSASRYPIPEFMVENPYQEYLQNFFQQLLRRAEYRVHE